LVKYLPTPHSVPKGKGKIFAKIILAVRKGPSAEGTLAFSYRQYYFRQFIYPQIF
jgi:hypothetical protein